MIIIIIKHIIITITTTLILTMITPGLIFN